MTIETVEWPNKIHYVDCYGCHRFIPGLPLAKRMEWLHLLKRFHALRLELIASKPDLLFRHFYDEFNADFSGNEHYSPEFKTLVDTLLSMHGVDPGGVSAEMAVVFLVGDKSTGDRPVLLALEFPDKADEDTEDIPEGISPEAYSKAHLVQYAGSPTEADKLLEERPYIEILEEVSAYAKVMENQSRKKSGKPQRNRKLDLDAPPPTTPAPTPDPKPEADPQSKQEALETMARMKALFEQDRLAVYATPAILPGMT